MKREISTSLTCWFWFLFNCRCFSTRRSTAISWSRWFRVQSFDDPKIWFRDHVLSDRVWNTEHPLQRILSAIRIKFTITDSRQDVDKLLHALVSDCFDSSGLRWWYWSGDHGSFLLCDIRIEHSGEYLHRYVGLRSVLNRFIGSGRIRQEHFSGGFTIFAGHITHRDKAGAYRCN